MIYPQKMWWKKYFQTLLKVTLECISGSVSFIQFFFYFIALGGPSKYLLLLFSETLSKCVFIVMFVNEMS